MRTTGEEMTFVNILKKIGLVGGQTALQILNITDPPLGAILSTILNSIMVAESKFGTGNGEQKKQDAMSAVQVAIPLILAFFKNTTGKDLIDETQLANGIDKLIDAVVGILNAFRILPKTA
jgi:hypothetical protein